MTDKRIVSRLKYRKKNITNIFIVQHVKDYGLILHILKVFDVSMYQSATLHYLALFHKLGEVALLKAKTKQNN